MAMNPYPMMLANAGGNPAMTEQMRQMALAQFLMGGGAAMAEAGSRPGATFGGSMARGMMGGMNAYGDVFDMALRNQMYANQQARADKQFEYQVERDKLEDTRRADEFNRMMEWRKSQNPFSSMMDGGGADLMTEGPSTLGGTMDIMEAAQSTRLNQAAAETWTDQQLAINQKLPVDRRFSSKESAQRFADMASQYAESLDEERKASLAAMLLKLRQRYGITVK